MTLTTSPSKPNPEDVHKLIQDDGMIAEAKGNKNKTQTLPPTKVRRPVWLSNQTLSSEKNHTVNGKLESENKVDTGDHQIEVL